MRLLTEQVGREILESRLEPGAWARALYQSEGRRNDALGHYTRIRIDALSSLQKDHEAKSDSFESRRVMKCMGNWLDRDSFIYDLMCATPGPSVSSPPMDLESKKAPRSCYAPRSGPQLNFMKPGVHAIWLWILFIGTASTLSLSGRLMAPSLIGPLAHLLTFIALLVAALAVWATLSVRQVLSKEWVIMGWKPLLVIACNVVCISSIVLSGHVIHKSVVDEQYAVNPMPSFQTPGPHKATAHVPENNAQFVSSKPVASAEDYLPLD